MPVDIFTVFVAISFLVLIHEVGHFLAARFFGIWVEEFGIGLPPRLFGIKIGETLYSVNLLPIGGFVKLHGEEEGSFDASKVKKKGRSFFAKPWWQRAIILVAGVAMNFLFSITVLTYLFAQGVPVPEKVLISEVVAGSPAESAGITKGDIILRVNGVATDDITDVTKIVSENLGQEMRIILGRTVEENMQEVEIAIVPRKNPPAGEGALGVVLSQQFGTKKYPLYAAPYHGLKTGIEMSYQLARAIVGVFWDFLSGFRVPKDVAGPIGMYQLYGEARKYGFTAVLELSGLISLNLAVVNLFPIPPMDGARLLFVLIERGTGKKLKKQWEYRLYQACFLILIMLFILISIQDIGRLFR